MFEAKLTDGTTLKKIVDSIKDLVTDVNLDVTPSGISLQAMDSSHVALVQLQLTESGFCFYRCDKPITLGLSITNLAKVMRLVNATDSIVLKCDSGVGKNAEPQHLTLVVESAKGDRTTEFTLNLISLDSESLGIPDTIYQSEISMNSNDFAKLTRELFALSETVTFEISQGCVKFVVESELGTGSIRITTSQDQFDSTKAVHLSFALRYLNLFNKAASLSQQVKL